MIRITAAAFILAAPAAAQAQQQCVTAQQVGDAAVVAAPILIDSVAGACKAHLPADAFLNTGAAELSARLRSEGETRVDSALAVLRLLGGDDFPALDNKAIMLAALGGLAQLAIAKEIKPESCPRFSGVIEALAPLPTDNIALLGSSIAMEIAASQEKKEAKRAAEAAEAAKAGKPAPKPTTERSKAPKICPNG